MPPLLWVVLGVFIWMVIGLFVLGETSKRYPDGNLWPPPAVGLGLIDLPLLILWLLLWPVSLLLASYFQRLHEHMSAPSAHAGSTIGLTSILAPGSRGITRTTMMPVGKIEIDGQLYDAQSQQGHLDVGVAIEVVVAWMKRPVVKAITINEQSN